MKGFTLGWGQFNASSARADYNRMLMGKREVMNLGARMLADYRSRRKAA